MTTIKAMRLASLVTAINVLVASGAFPSRRSSVRKPWCLPAPFQQRRRCYCHVRGGAHKSAGFVCIGGNLQRATSALLILGTLAAPCTCWMPNGLFQHDLGKFAGPLFIAVLQFVAVYLLHRSLRITP